MKQVVYVDVVFAVNLAVDIFLLWFAGRLAGLGTSPWRLAAGATVGSLAAVLGVMVDYTFLKAWWFTVLLALSILLLAYAPLSWRSYVRLAQYFFILAFLLAGTTFAVAYFLQMQGAVPIGLFSFSNLYWWVLVAGGAAMYSLIGLLINFIKERVFHSRNLRDLCFGFADQRVVVTALIDTGNQLRDPLSDRPVVIVEDRALTGVLPEQVMSFCQIAADGGNTELPEGMDPYWSSRFRLIPFSAIGTVSGMLVGFRPDSVEVFDEDRWQAVMSVVVCLYSRPLSSGGTYNAVAPPAVAEAAQM